MTLHNNQLDRIEAKLDSLLMSQITDKAKPNKILGQRYLHKLTTKQHATLQMVLDGKTNQDIADRMKIGINTAKVHVRGISNKLGFGKRAKICSIMQPEFDAVDDTAYLAMTGGLPKDWHKKFDHTKPCPYFHLYEKKKKTK